MADPGDTAVLCNDTKSHIQYEPGQPSDPDIEAGSVIGEEPSAQTENQLTEGDEEPDEEAGDEEQVKGESKIPFVYLIVEPGCTPLSCYSAIIAFFIMTCGIFWLLLISPPLTAKAEVTIAPWLEKNTTDVMNSTEASITEEEVVDALDPGSAAVAVIAQALTDDDSIDEDEGDTFVLSDSKSNSRKSSAVLPLEPDGPPNQT